MIQLLTLYFNALRERSYILWDETDAAVVIDPGAETDNERSRLRKFIDGHKLRLKAVLHTHGHFDHMLGDAFLVREYDVPVYIHAADTDLLAHAGAYGTSAGYQVEPAPTPAGFLTDGQVFRFGRSELRVLHTPGHTKGGVCFYAATDKFVITGDTLFRGDVGRVDLPGGDLDELRASLRTKLLPLPADTMVLPGHGPHTTIGEERANNPYLNERG
jgi:glyoxylase-like metal-dependent hydrolase (beta-lactamase superfamily II)